VAACVRAGCGAGAGAPALGRLAPVNPRALTSPVVAPAPPAAQLGKDAFGDPLPPGAVARLGTVRLRHGSAVSFVCFSPDGKTLAYGGSGAVDNTVPLAHLKRGEAVRAFALSPKERTVSRAFAPDGKTLAAGLRILGEPLARDGAVVVLWETATGKELRRLSAPGGQVTCLAFQPGGKALVTGGGGGEGFWWGPPDRQRTGPPA